MIEKCLSERCLEHISKLEWYLLVQIISQILQSITWSWQVLFSSHCPYRFWNCFIIFIWATNGLPWSEWSGRCKETFNDNFSRSSARTYRTASASHEFWRKYFLLNCVPFEMSTVIFLVPCHANQRSRPIMGSSRKRTKLKNLQL